MHINGLVSFEYHRDEIINALEGIIATRYLGQIDVYATNGPIPRTFFFYFKALLLFNRIFHTLGFKNSNILIERHYFQLNWVA